MEHSILHDRHAKIAAVGSSSTYGFGASVPTMSYPAQLQAMLRAGLPSIEFIVENEGQSGELAQAAAGRINADILSRSPDLVIWQVGSAEALKNVAVEAFAGTLSSELQTIRARKTDVVLIDMQWSAALQQSAHYVALNAAIHRVAAIEHVALAEGYDLMRAAALLSGQEKMLSPDGFHMNDDGYACLAETIAATIMTRLREDRVVGPAHSL